MNDDKIIQMAEYAKQYALTLDFQDEIDQIIRWYSMKGYSKQIKPLYDGIIILVGDAPRSAQVYAVTKCLIYLVSHVLVIDRYTKK